MSPDTKRLADAILREWWMVRYYGPRRTAKMRLKRDQAILKLGLTIRYAFNSSDDFETLIAAILDGGHPKDEKPF